MLKNVKKIGVIIVIAILFAFFSFSIVEVIMLEPDYRDYCRDIVPKRFVEAQNCGELDIPEVQEDACYDQRGFFEYKYDAQGCPVSYECNTCQVELDEASKEFRFVGFLVTTILGVIAIIAGLYVRPNEEVVEWVFSGILIGGIISIFIGTMMYFRDMGRFLRPIVLLGEMALIMLITWKTTRKK